MGRMEPDDLLCSRNARSRTPLARAMARPGKSIAKQSEGRAGGKYLPVGGRVRKSRALGDQSSPPSSEMIEELWLLDARNGDHTSRLAESR